MKPMTLILAGGEGRRMKGDKPLRLLGGRTLLARTVEYANRLGYPVLLSVRSPDQIGPFCDVSFITDKRDVEGPLAGVLAGMDWAFSNQYDALLTIPVDMPWLPNDLADRLIRKGNGHAVFAASGGKAHPVCALWPIDYLSAVQRYAETGGRSLRGLLEELNAGAVEWPVGDPDPFDNINDPAALAQAERRLQKSR